ncbi:MAG: hypothetical protein SFX74_04260 [Fimbriimonadaceae bacterium]|nr:hypothetical protein [Fimbriimonadaceae bacterium]
MIAFLHIAFLAVGQATTVPRYPEDCLIGPKQAYLIAAPRVISERPIIGINWSADGRTMTYLDRPPLSPKDWIAEGNTDKLNIYGPQIPTVRDIASGKTFALGITAPTENLGFSRDFIGQTNRVLFTYYRNGDDDELQVVRHVVANPDGLQFVLKFGAADEVTAVTSRVRNEYYLARRVTTSPRTYEVSVVDRNGATRRLAVMPGYLIELPDGDTVRTMEFDQARKLRVFHDYDLRTGKIERQDERVRPAPGDNGDPSAFKPDAETTSAPLASGFDVQQTEIRGTTAKRVTVSVAEAKIAASAGNVCDAGIFLGMNPTGTELVYVSGGVTLSRALVPVSASELRDIAAKQARRKAMREAQMTAFALIIFAGDRDNTLPSAATAGDWRSNLRSIVKDSELLARFSYTFAGGSIDKVERPTETMLGYVNTDFGRAVAYVDGSVKWVPK